MKVHYYLNRQLQEKEGTITKLSRSSCNILSVKYSIFTAKEAEKLSIRGLYPLATPLKACYTSESLDLKATSILLHPSSLQSLKTRGVNCKFVSLKKHNMHNIKILTVRN